MVTEQNDSLGFSDLLATLRRRRRVMLMFAVPLAASAILVALFAPTRYRSEAVFDIEESRLADMGQRSSQRENYVDQYVKDLQGVVMGTGGIRTLLAEQKRLPAVEDGQAAFIEKMKKNVGLRVISEQVLDPQSGRERTIISSFRIFSEAETPELAQQTTAALSDRFIAADRTTRLSRSDGYVRFLEEEAVKRKERVDTIEQQLADFKQRNIGQLPELNQMNLDFKDRAERDLQQAEAQLRTLVRERAFAQQQLQQAGQQTNGAQRLQELQDQYRDRLQTYDSNHPDMLALQREIDQLRAGGGRRTGSLRDQLSSQRDILAQARQRYSDSHPDIVRLQRTIAALEARIAAGETADTSAAPLSANELQARTTINSLDLQISSLQSQAEQSRSRIAQVRGNIQSTPQVEREYQTLSQDLSVARVAYQEVLQKKIEADGAVSAIRSGSADAFRLTQRASLPEGRVTIRSLAALVIGGFLAITLAFAAALLAEMFDPTVRGSRDIRQVLDVTPLAIIPEIANSTTHAARRARWMRLAASIAVCTVVLFAVGYRLSM
jgi:polysaccharide biosynthesis transport protein